MIRTICLTLFLVVASEFNLVAASHLQTQSDATLNNKDVVELVKIGLSPEVIVAKIKNSVCKFDTSTTALQELKAANVPDAVILAMVQAPASIQNSSLAASTSEPVEKPGVKNLYDVRRIYLDEMGKSDDAERFRLLLSEKLSDKGFTIVQKPDDADGILKGVLSTQLSEGTTRARVSVFLKSTSGQQLWGDDYGVRMVFGLPSRRRDSIKLRAEDVANGLHGAWKKPAKAAGKSDK